MSTSDLFPSGSAPERARLDTLVEQLQASCSWRPEGHWPAYLCAVCYGLIAALQGAQFLMLYLGVLVVVFLLQGFSEQRSRKQIGLLVELVRELDRKTGT
jgi:hypothetical protein